MRRLGLLLLPLLLASSGCRDSRSAVGTALKVEVSWASRIPVEQLRFVVSNPDGQLGEPIVRPEAAEGELGSPQSLRIRLSDALAGQELTVQVDGLLSGKAIARGTVPAVVVRGLEVTVPIELGGSPSVLRFAPPGLQLFAGECGQKPLRLLLSDQGEPASFPEETTLTLESSSAGGQFFGDPACAQPLTGLVVPAGASEVGAYYRDGKAGRPYVTARHELKFLEAATQDQDVGPGEPTRLALTEVVQPVVAGDCGRVVVEARDGFDNPSSTRADVFVAPSSSSQTAVFYPDSTCAGATLSTAVIPHGQTRAVFFVRDNIAATVTLTAQTPGFEPGTLQVTFGPRAATGLAFKVEPTTAAAAADLSPAVEVAIIDPFGNVVPTASTEVNLQLDPPEALPVSKLTTSSGVAVFQGLRVNAAGEYHLLASSIDFGQATSAAFTISSGTATRLGFVDQPQSSQAGATLPVVRVAIQDPGGNTVVGATNQITLASSGPGLSGTLTVAAVAGVAEFTNLAIATAGAGLTLTATATGLAQQVSAPFTVSGAGPASVRFSVQPSNAVAGATLSPAVVVRVEDAFGNLSSGFSGSVSLSFASGGAPGGTPVVSAAGGVATFDALHVDTAGSYVLRAAAGTLVADSNAFIIAAGAASKLAYLSQPVSGLAGAALAPPIQVAVQDAYGNTVTQAGSITMSLGNNPVGATLGGTLVRPLAAGVASFDNLTVSAAAAGFTLSASGAGFTRASAPFTISPANSNRLAFTGTIAQGTAGVALSSLSVRTLDSAGNPLATNNVDITLSLAENPAGGTLLGTLTAPTQAGVATFTDVRLEKSGEGYALQAQAVGAPYASARSNNFGVSPGQLASLSFAVNPQATATAGAGLTPPMQVKLLDAFSNAVTATTEVTLGFASAPTGGTLGGGPATVSSVNGVATFGGYFLEKAGDYQFRASASTLVVAAGNHTVVSAAPADRVAFIPQSLNAVAGQPIPTFAVEITDPFGNRAAGLDATLAVTVAIETSTPPGAATLNGTTTVVHSASVATFSGLSINRAALYSLRASASGLSHDISATFVINPGPPHHLEITRDAPNWVTSLIPIDPSVVVRVRDAQNNNTSGVPNITMTLSNANGAVLGGTLTKDASTGIATFTDLTVDKAGGPYRLAASASGLQGALGATFDVKAGAPAGLAFQGSPNDAIAGAVLSPVVVRAVDQAGNVAAIPAVTVNVSLGGPGTGGTLSGTTSVTTSGGVASFTTLWVNRVGTYHLDAASSGLGGAASGFFGIAPGLEHHYGFTQQPTSTNVNEVIAPAPVVTAYDAWDNVATGAGTNVLVELVGSSGNMKGTLEMQPVSGAATFSDLFIDTPGTGLVLKASSSSGGVGQATSTAFEVRSGAVRLEFTSAPVSAVAGTCFNSVTVSSVDAKGVPSPVSENHTLGLAWTAPATGSFMMNPLCNQTVSSVVLPAGSSQVTFNFRAFSAGSPVIAVTDLSPVKNLGDASQAQIVSVGPATHLAFESPPKRSRSGICSCPVFIHTTDEWGNNASVTAATSVSLSTLPPDAGGLTFLSNCGTPFAADGGSGGDGGATIRSVTVPAAGHTARFHFAGPVGSYSVQLSAMGFQPATQLETIIPNRLLNDTCLGGPAVCLPDGGTCIRGTAGLRCYPQGCLSGASCVLSGEPCPPIGNCCSGLCCGGVCQKANDGNCSG